MKLNSDLTYEQASKAIKEVLEVSNFQNDLETLIARAYKKGWEDCWDDTMNFKYAISSKGSEKKVEDENK